jgi:hypothetical protein
MPYSSCGVAVKHYSMQWLDRRTSSQIEQPVSE